MTTDLHNATSGRPHFVRSIEAHFERRGDLKKLEYKSLILEKSLGAIDAIRVVFETYPDAENIAIIKNELIIEG